MQFCRFLCDGHISRHMDMIKETIDPSKAYSRDEPKGPESFQLFRLTRHGIFSAAFRGQRSPANASYLTIR